MNAEPENPPARKASQRIGWLVLLCLFAIFAAYVSQRIQLLPDRVATHFGASGKPNGWMDRMQYRNFTLAIGIGTPLFVLAIFALIERMKGWGLNIPNKTYWLDPQRERGTYDFLVRQGFWLAGLLVLLHGTLFHQIVEANRHAPILLPAAHAFGTTGVFLAAMAVWIGVMLLRFRKPAA